MATGRTSTSKSGRSLQEISIPEGMDEEVCSSRYEFTVTYFIIVL